MAAIRNSASLDPGDFRHDLVDTPGKVQITQVDHPYQVRGLTQLHVPCACGRPLVGVEFELLSDPRGYALHFDGVCLSCGRQHGLYMSTPAVESEAEAAARREQRIRAEVDAMVHAVRELREDAPLESCDTTEAA